MQYLFSVGLIELINIGLYNVVKLKGVYCKECKCLLGTYLSVNKIFNNNDLLCFLCTSNLVLVADTLGFISPGGWAGCIEHLPSEQDLIKLGSRNDSKARAWYRTIQNWSKDIRDEHQLNKIRKLQNERS